MSFALVKPSGWAFGEIFTSPQLETLDADHAAAIDGVGGGTYAPSAPIIIGGSGLEVTGALTVSGAADFTGDVTLGSSGADTITVNGIIGFTQNVSFANDVVLGLTSGDAITVGGEATFAELTTFNGDAVFNADTTIGATSGDALTINASVTFESPVTFNTASVDFDGDVTLGNGPGDTITTRGVAEFEQAVTFAEPLTINDDATFNGAVTLGNGPGDDVRIRGTLSIEAGVTFGAEDVTFNGDCTFTNDVELGTDSSDTITVGGNMVLERVMGFTGSGRVPFRFATYDGDEDKEFAILDGNVFRATTNALSAPRAYSISTDDAEEGDFMFIRTPIPSTGQELTFGSVFNGGDHCFFVYFFDGTTWRQFFAAEDSLQN